MEQKPLQSRRLTLVHFSRIPQRNESSDLAGVRVRRPSLFRASFVTLLVSLTILAATVFSRAADGAAVSHETTTPPSNIVIGFVGGFVSHDNPHHGPVQLAEQMRRTVPKDTYIQ